MDLKNNMSHDQQPGKARPRSADEITEDELAEGAGCRLLGGLHRVILVKMKSTRLFQDLVMS